MRKLFYIAVEGPIGVGKTSLANLISKELGARLVLEKFEENPFLKDFYDDPDTIGVVEGPASGGWTIYPPLSALKDAIPGSGYGMTLWLLSITLFIVGSLLGGLNYIVTVLNLRTVGMSMKRLPLTVWGLLITAILVNFSHEKQNKYYCSFIVESVPIYWLVVEVGLQILF